MDYPIRPGDPHNIVGESKDFAKDDTGPEDGQSLSSEVMKEIKEIRNKNLEKFAFKM